MEHPSGFLLIDKPAGITSHDVVDRLRKITGVKKIGHAGTLDPFATGLLIVAVGREATREISTYVGMDKTYEAEFILGATTETLDPESEVQRDPRYADGTPLELNIEPALKAFTGTIYQVPPMYSAIKQKGKKLYELAREGKTVEREPREITIHSFELLEPPKENGGLMTISVRIVCSSGTYIRALARDVAMQLKTVGYVQTLRRTHIARYDVANAYKLDDLTPENWAKALQKLD